MHSAKSMRLLIMLTSAMLFACNAYAIATTNKADPYTVFVVHEIKHDTSLPLRDMTPVILPTTFRETPRLRLTNITQKRWHVPATDFTLQLAPGAALDIIQGVQFTGLGQGFPGFVDEIFPPDPNGSAGLDQYVQWVNVKFAVFNKHTGAVIQGATSGNQLWSGFGGACQNQNKGDPLPHYDRFAHRWVMSQFAFVGSGKSAPHLQCVAVSTSEDATGSYHRYAFSFDDFNDYGKIGIWPDPTYNAYYMTFNMFAGENFVGPRACALDRQAMLEGRDATMQCFQLNTAAGSLLPADLDGANLPPPKTPEFFLDFNPAGQFEFWRFRVNWAHSNLSKVEGPLVIRGTAPFAPACNGDACIPQRGTSETLDPISERTMYRLAYRQFAAYGAMLANHSIQTATAESGVRWYEIHVLNNGTYLPILFQQGTFSPDSNSRWLGSMAMDKVGNIALGYSVSGHIFPAIRITGRMKSDPLGELRDEVEVKAGLGFQFFETRWGDYSSMAVDPEDDCTFWYTNEYISADADGDWSTHVTSFKFPNCH